MTKAVRIENADNSDHVVSVEVWEEKTDGTDDFLVRIDRLAYPTQMLTETVWKGKYLVIREAAKTQT